MENNATATVEAAVDAATNNNGAVGLAFAGGLFMGMALLKGIQLTRAVLASRKAAKEAEADFDEEDDVDVTVNNNEDK